MKQYRSVTIQILFGSAVLATGVLSIIGSGGGENYTTRSDAEAIRGKEKQSCQALLETADIGSKPKDYRSLIVSYMSEKLKDPDSAKYSWDRADGPRKGFGAYAPPDDDCRIGWAVCVSINAKNSYGGYVGPGKWFFIIRDNEVKLGFKYNSIENTSGCL